ncbi:MAG: nucleotide-binding protein [Bacteroidales bacterium]|nr:nucleotide-binding protein [Bacteroidales bacterium]
MYYHIKIELNEKNKKDYHTNLAELDKTNIDEVINDTVLPYLQEKEFLFDGRMLTKSDIRSMKIYETGQTSQILVEMEDNKNRNNEWFFPSNKQDVVAYERYSKDTTKNIFIDASKKLNIKDSNIINKHNTNKVFIVHGHDEAVKTNVARFVEKLGLETIILHEQANKGQTIIEKFESNAAEVAFAIVLLTPDDIGAPKNTPDEIQLRARQNVIMELGYFCAALGRDKVCVLYKKDVEIPSDYLGVVYTEMDDKEGWHLKLAKEMKEASLDINLNNILQ